jgi:23S rRNA (cytidine2498-2'-O)-methyltransferase
MINNVIELVGDKTLDHLHVWQRDSALPGDHGFEPFPSPLAEELGSLIKSEWVRRRNAPIELNQIANAGQKVLDVVVVEPNEWWVGWHSADSVHQRWPGGVLEIEDNGDVISRAYYKLAEALAWGRIKIEKRDLCVEIGSAPGGAAQLLLELGASVIAVDPANLHESLSDQKYLKHIKKRGRQVRKSEFADARWLMVDVNVAPNFTLDTAEEIVTNPRLNIRGMVLTLKLTDWKLAEHIVGYRERVRGWGYKVVKTRQLAFHRHEICLVALKTRYDSRPKPMLKKDDQATNNASTLADSKRPSNKKPYSKPKRPFKTR